MLNGKRGNNSILKLRNGTPEERVRERIFQQEKRGMDRGWVTDSMERRRWEWSETLPDWLM